MDPVYLIDHNVVVRVGTKRAISEFVRDHCRAPAEVVYEGRDAAYTEVLRAIEYPVSAGVLRKLVDVMATVEPGRFDLVDLYKNQGNADPLLVATVLDAREKEAETLFANEWVIATEDNAVRDLAERFRVPPIGADDLATLIDAADG
jgi:hypothetical protein